MSTKKVRNKKFDLLIESFPDGPKFTLINSFIKIVWFNEGYSFPLSATEREKIKETLAEIVPIDMDKWHDIYLRRGSQKIENQTITFYEVINIEVQ